jgi:hypothetical protein
MIKPNSSRAAGGIGIVLQLGAALGAGVILPSCKPVGERMEITETREVSRHAPPPASFVASPKRFRMEQESQESTTPRENPLAWVVPEGWTEAGADPTPGGMRLINLRFGSGGEGECYLSAMPGSAGGLEANINRWRGQMGLPALSADELAKLPKKPFLNREATYVSMDGDFKGVGATDATKGYRLVGLVQPAPEFTLFVKMTGPKELIEKNEAAFDQFIQSLSIKGVKP